MLKKADSNLRKYAVKVFLDKLAYHAVTGNAFISGLIKELRCEASFNQGRAIKVVQKRNSRLRSFVKIIHPFISLISNSILFNNKRVRRVY